METDSVSDSHPARDASNGAQMRTVSPRRLEPAGTFPSRLEDPPPPGRGALSRWSISDHCGKHTGESCAPPGSESHSSAEGFNLAGFRIKARGSASWNRLPSDFTLDAWHPHHPVSY